MCVVEGKESCAAQKTCLKIRRNKKNMKLLLFEIAAVETAPAAHHTATATVLLVKQRVLLQRFEADERPEAADGREEDAPVQ